MPHSHQHSSCGGCEHGQVLEQFVRLPLEAVLHADLVGGAAGRGVRGAILSLPEDRHVQAYLPQ